MHKQMSRLVRLAELRNEVAKRAQQAAQANVGRAQAAVAAAQAAKSDLATQITSEKEALREAFLDAPRARAALADLLTDLRGKDERTEAAQAQLESAQAGLTQAQETLKVALAAVRTAHVALEKRRAMLAPLTAAAHHAAEQREEAEAAETAQSQRAMA